MPDFYLKQNDTLPLLQATLSGIDTLAGATVKFLFRERNGNGTVKTRNADIINPTAKTVQVVWQAGDLATAGDYVGEFQVTVSGNVLTFPNDGYIQFRIVAEIGS